MSAYLSPWREARHRLYAEANDRHTQDGPLGDVRRARRTLLRPAAACRPSSTPWRSWRSCRGRSASLSPCYDVDIDGLTVRVQGVKPVTEEAQQAVADLVAGAARPSGRHPSRPQLWTRGEQ